ncbi:unnamed protein product, partial [Ixodes pacificus]
MVLATLSKEQGITVVAVCVVYEFLVVQAPDENDEEVSSIFMFFQIRHAW